MRTAILAAGVCLSMLGPCFAQTTAATIRIETHIPQQSLGQALKQFGEMRHLQVLFLTADVKDLRTKGASGDLTAGETLDLLLRGTGLKYRYVDANAVSIFSTRGNAVVPLDRSGNETSPAARPKPILLGASPTTHRNPDPATRQRIPSKKASAKDGLSRLQEVVVTGTYIVGVRTTASPMSTYSRAEIYATGASNIYEFMKALPTNLGDVNPLSVAANQYGLAAHLGDSSESVAFDLDGLGPQSTLVLVNGQRLAPGNGLGDIVDVSLIPLNAISRIDIVKDSASSTYGSDAVGGVVNINTLQKFTGSESAVRYGTATKGGRHDEQADETWGRSWSGGSAVLAYEYDDQTPLDAASRSFTVNLPSPYTLLPEQTRHGFYGSLVENPNPDVKLNGFAVYGHRSDLSNEVQGGTVYRSDTEVDGYLVGLGTEIAVSRDGIVTTTIDNSGNDTKFNQLTGAQGSTRALQPFLSTMGRFNLTSLNFGYSGWFGHLPGGRVGVAAGAQAREENFELENYVGGPPAYKKSRTIVAEYLETNVPLASSLNLDASVRHERYSDFGDTTNPKVGLRWDANSSTTLTTTYGTSFVAPTLNELVPNSQGLYAPLPDPQKTGPCSLVNPALRAGCATVVVATGGNPRLGPEKADTWTAGVRLNPRHIVGLNAEASFYAINERGVVNTAYAFLPSIINCLLYANELGPTVVAGITAQEAQRMFPISTNNFNVNESDVSTLCDGRDLNLSKVSTRGIDLELKFLHSFNNVGTKTSLSGTKILSYRTQFSPLAPSVSILNTVNKPVDLRGRLGESIVVSDVSMSAFVNYVGPYRNNIVLPTAPISSWTTVDLVATYSAPLGTPGTGRLSITIGVDNVADRNPPFVFNNSAGFPLDFDGANASPLGRFVYAELRLNL